MKKTNFHLGARGINLENGSTFWVEPGQDVTIVTKGEKQFVKTDEADLEVRGNLPDFGRKVDAEADAAAEGRIEALEAENADLKKQIASLQADLEKATKPAK